MRKWENMKLCSKFNTRKVRGPLYQRKLQTYICYTFHWYTALKGQLGLIRARRSIAHRGLVAVRALQMLELIESSNTRPRRTRGVETGYRNLDPNLVWFIMRPQPSFEVALIVILTA